CLQALRTGEIIEVIDLATDVRWPRYRPIALRYGVRSSLSLPVKVNGHYRGALNLYALTPRAFETAARARAELFAAQAAAALTVVTRQAQQMKLSDQLREALASRSVIDQA